MIDSGNDIDTVEIVENSNIKKVCKKEINKSAQNNGDADKPSMFFRVCICKSDEERVIVSDPFLISYKGVKSSDYKNIINEVISLGNEEPIKLLFNLKRAEATGLDAEYLVLDQMMFESTIDYVLKHSKNEIIVIKAVSYTRSSAQRANGNTSTTSTTSSGIHSFGQKLLNRLEHAKTVASDDVKVKINQIIITNKENQEITTKELLENNIADLYLSFGGRNKHVTYQSSQERIKINATSQEIIDFVNNQKTPVKSRKGNRQI